MEAACAENRKRGLAMGGSSTESAGQFLSRASVMSTFWNQIGDVREKVGC